MSASGYAKQQVLAMENASPQQTLAWGLTTTARKLAAAMEPNVGKDAFLDAVRLNWRLWTIIQAEQSDPDCTTERSIRESLLNLANFIDKRTIDILARPAPEKLEILISINRNIAAGLLGIDQTPEQKAEREKQSAP